MAEEGLQVSRGIAFDCLISSTGVAQGVTAEGVAGQQIQTAGEAFLDFQLQRVVPGCTYWPVGLRDPRELGVGLEELRPCNGRPIE